MIIASTSTLHGGSYLEYLLPTLETFYSSIRELLFIPYARPGGVTYDAYTNKAALAFKKMNISVTGIHEYNDLKNAVKNAEGIFTGGGNTFELVNQLYKNDLMEVLKEKLEAGTLYLGTSAGSNICGVNMRNTNDMPIVYPPNFDTLGMIPFNINAHYLDPDPNSTHMGETRETRIKEFHVFNETPVLGLREGSWLKVDKDQIILEGELTARWFQKGKLPIEIAPKANIHDYIN